MSSYRTIAWSGVLIFAMLMGPIASAACGIPIFTELPSVPAGLQARQMAVGDVNNDGDIDLVTVSQSAVNVQLGNGAGDFSGMLSYTVTSAEEVALGDVDNDTFLDIVVSQEPGVNEECVSFGSCAGYSVLLNDGDGTFGLPTVTLVPFAATVAAIDIADFNDDGNRDLLIAADPVTTPDPKLHVLFGDGAGSFPSRRSWTVAGQVRDAVAAKLNPGNAQPDVIAAVSPATAGDFLQVIVYPSQSGTFPGSSASRNIMQSNSEVHLTTADFNGNGGLDIGLSFEHSSAGVWGAAVVLANGNSSLTGPGFYAESSPALTSIAALDLDEDGDNDIVTTYVGNLWKGFLRENANFTEFPVLFGPFDDTTAQTFRVLTTDFDKDGRPDMLFLDVAHDVVLVLRNTCPARDSTVHISSSPNPSTFGDDVTFNVQVEPKPDAPTPTGIVRIMEGETVLGEGTLDANGAVSITVSDLSLGEHFVIAHYEGDSEFAGQESATHLHTVLRPPFGPPLNVIATGNGAANQITIRWIATADSTSHDVLRRLNGAWSVIAPDVVGEQFIDSNVNNTSAYVYAVRSRNAGGQVTAESNSDIATTATLALPADKRIRATDITTTRSLINSLRSAAGLAPFTFTDASLTGVRVKAIHITELRNALNPARTALGFAALTFTNPTLTPTVTPIRLIDIMEIRNSFQ